MTQQATRLCRARRRPRAGKTTPRAYLDECLKRIAELDPTIGAFVKLNKDGAIKAADASTARWRAGKPLSPIDGMPVAIKDIIETADMPTGQGSPMWEGTDWKRDSAGVHALREAGAVISARPPPPSSPPRHPWHKTQNPHDGKRTPGGSSSGSAAAVGSGMVPAGLGTQVVGSILRPASFCGAIGFKPSVGAINRSGSHDHFSQSCQGAIGATLADTWAVLRAIADRAGGDPGFVGFTGDVDFTRRAKPARLAVLETGGWAVASEGARKAFAAAKEKLAKPGIELKARADDPDIEALEKSIADAQPLTLAINAWEGRWPLNTYADLDATKLSQGARDRLKTAEAGTQKQYADNLSRRVAARAAHAKAAAKYDAFVTSGRLRRSAGRPPLDRQHRNECGGLAARLPGADRAAAGGRRPAARPAASRRDRPRRRSVRVASFSPTTSSAAPTWWARRRRTRLIPSPRCGCP